jgi:hypothetical protein
MFSSHYCWLYRLLEHKNQEGAIDVHRACRGQHVLLRTLAVFLDASAFINYVPYQCYALQIPSFKEALFLAGHDSSCFVHFHTSPSVMSLYIKQPAIDAAYASVSSPV